MVDAFERVLAGVVHLAAHTNVLNNRPLTIYGDGSQTRDFIHVDDLCRAIILSMEKNDAK